MSIKETKCVCVVCEGKIVEKIENEFNPTFGVAIIGPGSLNQFCEISKGFYCKGCGLKYEFLSSEKIKN